MTPQDSIRPILPTPKSYAQKVLDYSRCEVGDCYFTGVHYKRLGEFLHSPYQMYGGGITVPWKPNDFAFAALCDLRLKRGDVDRIRSFSRPEEFFGAVDAMAHKAQSEDDALNHSLSHVGTSTSSAAGSQAPSSTNGHHKPKRPGMVVFLRGYGSAVWLNHVGAALDVDPELFYRHLAVTAKELPSEMRLEHSYSTPFPQTRNLLQLRMCNTGSLSDNSHGMSLSDLRKNYESRMRDHVEDFVRMRNFAVGDSIVRRFILHDLHNFSIEQRVSIEVIHRTNTWSILVWLDTGNDLGQCTKGPWLQEPNAKKTDVSYDTTTFHPVFQHRSRMALEPVTKTFSGQDNALHPQSIHQLVKNFGGDLNPEIMAQDAFYALHELFEFSAASIDQVLELCESNTIDIPHESLSIRLSELLLLKAYVDDYRGYVKDTLATVRAGGDRSWPRVKEGTPYWEKANRAAVQLELRYKRLLERCERLQDNCANSMTILMNQQAQQQNERAMEQTKQLNKLSILAYFYIPITFTTSFFGMNFKELGNSLSIWIFFLMAFILVIISVLAWIIDFQSLPTVGRKLTRTLCMKGQEIH